MPKSTKAHADLVRTLSLSRTRKPQTASASIAFSRSGTRYKAGRVETQSHILDVPSELAALVQAMHAHDVDIEEVRTVVANPKTTASPLVLKILADHAARTGVPIRYSLYAKSGKTLFKAHDVQKAIPFYNPDLPLLKKSTPSSARAKITKKEFVDELRSYARAGIARNFPTKKEASGYGAAVLTTDGTVYFGGQYSTPDHRLGVHAEMGVILDALMQGAKKVRAIGIVSTKFPTSPCSPCGSCRQFIAELSARFGWSPTLYLFAAETSKTEAHDIQALLPVQWTSEK